jgi:hypothetical protein
MKTFVPPLSSRFSGSLTYAHCLTIRQRLMFLHLLKLHQYSCRPVTRAATFMTVALRRCLMLSITITFICNLGLTAQEESDLVEYLKSLPSED